VGYGHAGELAAMPPGKSIPRDAAGRITPPPLDAALWEPPAMRAALRDRDIGAVYRMLCDAGIGQRQIAERTGQAQSEVSEICNGRQVIVYDVLTRIADGLGYRADTWVWPTPHPSTMVLTMEVNRRRGTPRK